MAQSSEFLVCASCGTVSARVELETCKQCGAHFKVMDLEPSDSDEFWNLLEEIDSIVEDVEVANESSLKWESSTQNRVRKESVDAPFSTDRFNAVTSHNSDSFIDARKEARQIEHEKTPKKGIFADVVERVMVEETTASGTVSPVAKAAKAPSGGMQIMKRRRSSKKKSRQKNPSAPVVLLSSTAHSDHRQLSSKLIDEEPELDFGVLDSEIDWDAAFDSEANDD